MTAVLTAESGDLEKVAEIIVECKRMNILVLPPDINESFGDFTVIKNDQSSREEIRFGLYSVKNLGTDIAQSIIDERKTPVNINHSPIFLTRVKHKNLNKKSLESLIKCGGYGQARRTRGPCITSAEEALNYNRQSGMANENQTSLFGGMESAAPVFRLKDAPEASKEEKLAWGERTARALCFRTSSG